MSSTANKEEALRCVSIAERHLRAGNVDKALKFCNKSMQLYSTDEARSLLSKIKRQQAGGGGGPTPAPAPKRAASSPTPRHGTETRTPTPAQLQLVRKLLSTKDLYARLGVERNADEAEMKRAYRKLSLKAHPDKNPSPDAEKAFQAVNKAWEILGDEQKRRYYDQTGAESPQAAAAEHQQHGGMGRGFHGAQNINMDDFLYQMFNGHRMPGQRHNFRPRGQQQQQRQQQQGQGGGGGGDVFAHLIFVFIMFISLFSSSFDTSSNRVFKLERESPFVRHKNTDAGVNYYVKVGGKLPARPPAAVSPGRGARVCSARLCALTGRSPSPSALGPAPFLFLPRSASLARALAPHTHTHRHRHHHGLLMCGSWNTLLVPRLRSCRRRLI